eukprot:CAMPEP_0116010446 /NCGR_PEP_ID=MMETSP0321-20121206/4006_1 /TAXON_ID=163516 /ORGANISM="Leptocylindrus danicus var. danicus, Strain B650" /LENGTH=50 /DNA_ID=CAMNT_0003479547 /DNA_START=423 /DNA_END=572 /DNA_ORIENTATION=+
MEVWVAPMGLDITGKKLRRNPFMIALAVDSNVGRVISSTSIAFLFVPSSL